jgi:hypothetical protein
MKRSNSAESGQAIGEEKVPKKGECMKVTVFGTRGQVIGTVELRPRTFRSHKKGYWSTTKLIDWETRQQFQFNVYAVEIRSRSNGENELNSGSENDPDKQQSLL